MLRRLQERSITVDQLQVRLRVAQHYLLNCRLRALVLCLMNFENKRRMKNVLRLPSRSLNIGKSIRSPMPAVIRRRTFRLKSQTHHSSSALPATSASVRRL
jgi:hypothetical protein